MADSLLKSNIIVKNEYFYTSFTETLREQYQLFNAATRGGLVMLQRNHVGDFSDEIFWKWEDGLTSSRNPYDQKDETHKSLSMISDNMVKMGRRIGPIDFQPSSLGWIGRTKAEHDAARASQVAAQEMRAQLNIAINAYIAAVGGVPELNAPTQSELTWQSLLDGASLFGDQYQDILCWVMPSSAIFKLWGNNLQNASHLFQWGGINVMSDPLGKPIIITDNATLINGDSAILGLTSGAVQIHDTGYFLDDEQMTLGKTNIMSTYQAEFDIEIGVKGFAYNATDATKAPDETKIKDKKNWKKVMTSHKDLAGVLIKVPKTAAAASPAAGA